MALDILTTLYSIEVLENYIDKIRPKEELRDMVDLTYMIENQSITIYEIRPHFNLPAQKIESQIAKTTFVKAKNHWKVLWMGPDLKWHTYTPHPIVNTLKEFVELVDQDKYGCFWG